MKQASRKKKDTHEKEPWRCPLCEGDDIDGPSPFELLCEAGVPIPPPELVDEMALRDVLWDIVEALAWMGIYILNTDHLSDRQLYALLCDDLLRQPLWGTLDPPDTAMWIDILGGCSNEDIELWLRYFASDDDRREWQGCDPAELPERRPRPFDRDRYMPRRETFWAGRYVPPPWRTSATPS